MKNKKRMLALLLATVTTLSACGQGETKDSSEVAGGTAVSVETSETSAIATESSEVTVDIKDLPVISFYPQKASIASGIVEGYKAQAFAKAGVQVEVWAHSAEKTTGILTSGELPDIMYLNGKDNLTTVIENGYALCLDDYLDKLPNLTKVPAMEKAIEHAKSYTDAAAGSVYYIPAQIGEAAGMTTFLDAAWQVPKVYWDVYDEIGRPEVKDFYDLIDVMEQMVAAHPTTEDGAKVWGTILDDGKTFKDYWGPSQEWLAWNGYSETFAKWLVAVDAVNEEMHYLLEDDGIYYEGLKWYNEMYTRGLLDPDSINSERGAVNTKIESGQVMIPTGTLVGYADDFHEVVIPGQVVYSEMNPREVASHGWVISAETEHLEECLAFVNLMMDPDFVLEVEWGPEGDIWYVDEKGDAYITEEYAKYCADESIYPDGFPMSTGETWAWWNTSLVLSHHNPTSYGDGKGGYRTSYVQNWADRQAIVTATDNMREWQEFTGYDYLIEMLVDQDMLKTSMKYDSRINSYCEVASDEMLLQISSIGEKVKNASWLMVYAESEAEFEKIWEQLQKDVDALDGKKLYDWGCENIENAAIKAGTAK